jgi:hypothetical protein
MPQITYTARYNVNTDLVFSPEELQDQYFFGIPLTDQSGNSIPKDTIKTYIASAQEEVEHFLDIKLKKQVYEEYIDYDMNNFMNWSYLNTTFPVIKPLAMQGWLGNIKQVEFPVEWLVANESTDEKYRMRAIYLLPTYGAATYQNSTYLSVIRGVGFGNRSVPEYWHIKYITGYDKLPKDLLDLIGKLASIKIFHLMGDIILGAGIASRSLSLDGLSQSISTTQSAENSGYSGRIKGYLEDLKKTIPRLEGFYQGIKMSVV